MEKNNDKGIHAEQISLCLICLGILFYSIVVNHKEESKKMGIHAFGNSITVGTDTPAGTSYIKLLENDISPIINHAVSGHQAGDGARTIFPTFLPADGDKYLVMYGTNDQRGYKDDVLKQQYFLNALFHNTVYLLTPNKKRHGDLIKTGSWSGYSDWYYSSNQGDTISTTVSGSTVYVSYIMQSSPVTVDSEADVLIDGNLVKSYTCDGTPTPQTIEGDNYFPVLLRIHGLAPGEHTVDVIVKSSGKRIYVHWIAGNDQTSKTEVYLSNIPNLSPAQYVSDGITVNTTFIYNLIVGGVVNALNSDGHLINLIDINPLLTETDLGPDGIHPSESGHQKIYQAFLDAILGVPSEPPVEPPPSTESFTGALNLSGTVNVVDGVVTQSDIIIT